MLYRQNNWFWCPHCHNRQFRRTWATGIGHLTYDVLQKVIAWHGRIEEQMWNEYKQATTVPLADVSSVRGERLPER